ncbi:MAG: 6-phosphogluconolactonase [Candidatus Nanopelagicales bacterium]
MTFQIMVVRDFDQLSAVAADIVENDISAKSGDYVLGLATGNSPSGLYKYLAKDINEGRLDPTRITTFNLDEYVGLPGENAQQRALHPSSYGYFMVSELFALMKRKFRSTYVPWGALVDQPAFEAALAEHPADYTALGADRGKAIVIDERAGGILGEIRDLLNQYTAKVSAAGGVDLQIIGVGGRGHVAFHESGIPFDCPPTLLVALDTNTIANAVADGHFASRADSPHFAISMSATLVYQAKTVVLLASGPRKTGPITEAVLGPVTDLLPVSYGQRYVEQGGKLIYVLDEAAAAGLLERRAEVDAHGFELIDLRGQEYPSVSDLKFARDPQTGRLA